jgi:phosphomannomutase
MVNAADKSIIAFDVDGTITESKRPIADDMSNLICELLSKKRVALISGAPLKRFYDQLLSFMPCVIGAGAAVHNLVLLPANGSQCYEYDVASNEWILVDEEKLAPEIKEKVMQAIEEIIYDPALDVPKNPAGEYVEDRGTQLTFSALGQDAALDKKALWDLDHKKRQKIKAALEEKVGSMVEVVIAGTTSVDVNDKGFNKATGLLRLLNRLGLSMQDMLFVGDSIFPGGNDFAPKEAGIESVKVSGPEETAQQIKLILQS